MILDLDQQYRESISHGAGCPVPSRESRRRREFGVACVGGLGGFGLLATLAIGPDDFGRIAGGVRNAFVDFGFVVARVSTRIGEADSMATRGVLLGTFLILLTVHMAERHLNRRFP